MPYLYYKRDYMCGVLRCVTHVIHTPVMCKTPVLHMFYTCNTGVYVTHVHVLYVLNYMCNIGVYPTSALHV